jgi:hypothetical protein
MENFPGIRPDEIRCVGDPAMFTTDREDDEQDWRLACQKALGSISFAPRATGRACATRRSGAQKERDGYQIDEGAAPDQGP